MFKITIYPGSMAVVSDAIDLFGIDRVDPGSWTTPVWVKGLSEDEVKAARELFSEKGKEISVEAM